MNDINLLSLPLSQVKGATIRVSRRNARRWIGSVRGMDAELPMADVLHYERGRFGEDLVGGWLRESHGPKVKLVRNPRIAIPIGGLAIYRRADWVLDDRIIVEVKTTERDLGQGSDAENSHQISDFARWRDFRPSKRALVLARVSWKGNLTIDKYFFFTLRHFAVPILRFRWHQSTSISTSMASRTVQSQAAGPPANGANE